MVWDFCQTSLSRLRNLIFFLGGTYHWDPFILCDSFKFAVTFLWSHLQFPPATLGKSIWVWTHLVPLCPAASHPLDFNSLLIMVVVPFPVLRLPVSQRTQRQTGLPSVAVNRYPICPKQRAYHQILTEAYSLKNDLNPNFFLPFVVQNAFCKLPLI